MWHYHMPLQISSMKSNNNFRLVALHEGNKEEILLFLTYQYIVCLRKFRLNKIGLKLNCITKSYKIMILLYTVQM